MTPLDETLIDVTPKPRPKPAPQPVPAPLPSPDPVTPAPVPAPPTPAKPSVPILPWLVGGLATLVLGGTILLGSLALRSGSTSDSTLVSLGRTYATQALTAGHASSLEEAAVLVEKGGSLKDAFDKAHADFEATRTATWSKAIKPHLEQIVPTQTPNADITAEQRASLAHALREIAKGERGASR